MFERGTLNPHYFANPPAFTYVLHGLFTIAYGGAGATVHASRARSARRLHARRVSPPPRSGRWRCGCCTRPARGCSTAASVCWRLRSRRWRSCPCFTPSRAQRRAHAGAGDALAARQRGGAAQRARRATTCSRRVGLGLACASKYTGGIVIVPLAAAVPARLLADGPAAGRRALRGVALAAVCCARGVLHCQPVFAARLQRFHAELVHQSNALRRSTGQARRAAQRRHCLLPVVADVGSRLGAGAGCARRRDHRVALRARSVVAAGPGGAGVSRIHGAAGAVLRALAAADLPDPVHARGELHGAGGTRRDPARATPARGRRA